MMRPRGDDFDVEQLFREHYRDIYQFSRRRLDPDAALDLASEVFAQALSSRRSYDPQQGSGRAWLFGICHNLLLRRWRDTERMLRAYARYGVGSEIADDDHDAVLERIDARHVERSIARALLEIPDNEREALLLSAWTDLSSAEIGDVLDIPAATVRTRVHRARRLVREQLARSGQVLGKSTPSD